MGRNESGLADVKTRLILTLALPVWLVRQNMFLPICGYSYLERKPFFWGSRAAQSFQTMLFCVRSLTGFKIVTASVNPDIKASMQNFL